MAPNPNLAAVTAYFDGLRRKNVDEVPFSPDVRFESPLSPPIQGVRAVREFLKGVFPVITGVRVLQMLSDGQYVAARFELDTFYGVIPAFDWFMSSTVPSPRRGRTTTRARSPRLQKHRRVNVTRP